MESSKREGPHSGGQSFPGLLEAASGRVQAIIEAAETSAAGILEDARSEARRYADEARQRVDEVSRERTQRVAALTDELNSLGEELIRQAESMRSQAQAMAGALGRAANQIYTDLEEQEAQLDGLAPDESALEPEFDDAFGLEDGALGEEFEEVDETEAAMSENGDGAERRRGLWRGFRRREDEPGTGELAVIDEVAEDVEEIEIDEDAGSEDDAVEEDATVEAPLPGADSDDDETPV